MNIISFIVGLFLIYIIGRILFIPIKIICRLIKNGLVGGLTLVLFNLIGKYFGLYIEITPLNSLLSGFLGVVGIVLILVFENFF